MKIKITIFCLIVCNFLYSAIYAQVSTAGLIAFYPFNGNANDESGNNNNGVVHGAQLTSDRYGNPNSAYYFDGNEKYISVISSSSLNSPTNQLTMSGWAMVMGPSFRHYIVDKRINFDSSSPFDSYVLLSAPETQIQKWQAFVSSSPSTVTGTSNLKLNVWTFVVGVFNGAKLDLYIDGIFEASIPVTNNISYSNYPLYIGAGGLKPEHYMNGKIDDVRLYNRILTPEEIWNLYNEPGIKIPSIIGIQNVCAGKIGAIYTVSNMDSIINYSWSYSGSGANITNLTNSLISVDFASNASSGTLSVIGNKEDGSKDSAKIEIIVSPIPKSFASSNSPVCEGNQLILSAHSVSGGSYTWTDPYGFSSFYQDLIINNSSKANEGNYTLSVTANGCTSEPYTLNVEIEASPVSLASSNSPICEGSQLLLSAQTVPGGSYIWSGSGGFSSSSQNPVINNATHTNTGTYTLWVSANGCLSPPSTVNAIVSACGTGDLGVIKIVSDREPKIGETIEFTIIAMNNSSEIITDIQVIDILQSGYSYLSSNATKGSYDPISGIWTLGSLNSFESHVLTITVSVNINGDYGNTATILSNQSESNLANNVSYVETIPTEFNIPNSFSPNGDGVNDYFVIRGLLPGSKLMIFNNEGRIVFESDNYQNDWDGKSNDGEILNSDTYWYVLSMPGIPAEFKNFVYLKN